MTTGQNPIIPTPTNPIEIDRAIVDMLDKLNSGLVWLTHGYPRAYKNLDVTQSKEPRFYPEIYLGQDVNTQKYFISTPDNDKQGQCFFYVRRENVSEWQAGQYPFLSYEVALIFSANLSLINQALLNTEYFEQNLVNEVRTVLINNVGVPYNFAVASVDYDFQDVFREFQVSDQQQLEKSPLCHFRFNLTIEMQAECF